MNKITKIKIIRPFKLLRSYILSRIGLISYRKIKPDKYFHELTDEEYERLKKSHVRWCDVPTMHPRPKWCDYSSALCGEMGCLSLVHRRNINKDYCSKCDCFISSAK